MAKKSIKLTEAEIESNYDRVQFAEDLIKQLPEDHDGRNTWLMNYGSLEKFDRAIKPENATDENNI